MEQEFKRTIALLREKIQDYEWVREHLLVRAISAERRRHELTDAIYETVGDIALVVYLRIAESEEGMASTKIRRWNLEPWDISPEDLYEQALISTAEHSPATTLKIEDILMLSGELEIPREDHPEYYCLTTENHMNGAVAIFFPGVADDFCEKFDSDLYLAFTSVHEVMVHSTKSIEADRVRSILRCTIDSMTPPEDFLSNQVYCYSRTSKQFHILEEDIHTS